MHIKEELENEGVLRLTHKQLVEAKVKVKKSS